MDAIETLVISLPLKSGYSTVLLMLLLNESWMGVYKIFISSFALSNRQGLTLGALRLMSLVNQLINGRTNRKREHDC